MNELARLGTPFRGCLYAGIMVTPTGPRVFEWNARFGDPEAQVMLPRLDADLVDLSAGPRPARWATSRRASSATPV